MAVSKIEARDATFAVEVRGTGEPLLLVHGFPLDRRLWDAQLDAWSATRRVIAPDLRGFGESSVTPGTVTMDDFADDLATILDALEVRAPVAVAGLSMGGYVAFAFWRRHAARVGSFALLDTRAIPDTPEGAEGRRKLADRILAEGVGPLVESMMPKALSPRTAARHPEIVANVRAMMERQPAEGVAATLRGLADRPDSRPTLGMIAVPTLVLVGEDDAISSAEEMREIAAGIRGAEFVCLSDAGHMTPMEQPQAVSTALAGFLARRRTIA